MNEFLATFGNIVRHTPSWVWILYALLLFLGFQRTRDSVVALWRVLILPLVVLCLAISTLAAAGLGALPVGLAGLAFGAALGWQMEGAGNVRRLPHGRMWVRGEWWSFAQLVVVLMFRYAAAATNALHPEFNAAPSWRLGTLFVSVALSAMFLGRLAAKLRLYFADAVVVT